LELSQKKKDITGVAKIYGGCILVTVVQSLAMI